MYYVGIPGQPELYKETLLSWGREVWRKGTAQILLINSTEAEGKKDETKGARKKTSSSTRWIWYK